MNVLSYTCTELRTLLSLTEEHTISFHGDTCFISDRSGVTIASGTTVEELQAQLGI